MIPLSGREEIRRMSGSTALPSAATPATSAASLPDCSAASLPDCAAPNSYSSSPLALLCWTQPQLQRQADLPDCEEREGEVGGDLGVGVQPHQLGILWDCKAVVCRQLPPYTSIRPSRTALHKTATAHLTTRPTTHKPTHLEAGPCKLGERGGHGGGEQQRLAGGAHCRQDLCNGEGRWEGGREGRLQAATRSNSCAVSTFGAAAAADCSPAGSWTASTSQQRA